MKEWMKCVLVMVAAIVIIVIVEWLQALGIPTGFGMLP